MPFETRGGRPMLVGCEDCEMRVLLSDGSGLTARQVATELSLAGHRVEVLTPDPLALTRFTRHVARLHKVPPFGTDPFAWLKAALDVYRGGDFDVLFPTQEQVAVLAAARPDVVTAVPTFEALSRVQDKISASATLQSIGLPQPRSWAVHQPSDLEGWDWFPAFAKPPIGTATRGIRPVRKRSELFWEGVPFLLQERVEGPLVMAQSVFDHGRLVASAANLRVREGASGGASHKRSVELPLVREYLAQLGAHLKWHGALSADVILGADTAAFIDINPRLVEPGNASRAGVNLVDALLDVALGRNPAVQPVGEVDVTTHQLLLAVLGAAQSSRGRRAVLRELRQAAGHRASYEGSVEELTPVRHDLPRRHSRDRCRSRGPCLAAVVALLLLGCCGEPRPEPGWLAGHRVHADLPAETAVYPIPNGSTNWLLTATSRPPGFALPGCSEKRPRGAVQPAPGRGVRGQRTASYMSGQLLSRYAIGPTDV